MANRPRRSVARVDYCGMDEIKKTQKKKRTPLHMNLANMPTTFPYKKITDEEAMADYVKLQQRTFINNMSRQGNKATDIFTFKQRCDTTCRKMTHLECFHQCQPQLLKCMISLKYKEITPSAVRASIRMRIGSVNQFRPTYAKFIYKKYNVKKVIDISAGWGGRCLGAMACGIDYTGFDTNTDLREAYDKIIHTYPNAGNCQVIFKDSATVDYADYDYDCVFTSPPYYMLEKYANMPAYTSKADFDKKYWLPVVKNSWQHLKTGGHYILNCPAEMMETACGVIGKKYDEVLPYYISSRVKDGKKRFENVYVWKK